MAKKSNVLLPETKEILSQMGLQSYFCSTKH